LLGITIPLLYGILMYANYYPYDEVIKLLSCLGFFVTILMTAAPLISLVKFIYL